jgi:CHAD domain-containing protein
VSGEVIEMSNELVALRPDEISPGAEASPIDDNWLRADLEFAVAHDYDTGDRDLEQLGMTLSRLPSEAGVEWRLTLPRGERVEAWEPGNNGLDPPVEIVRLIGGVVGAKELVPGPPPSADPGATRLREVLERQRDALVTHDPGVRLGTDPENLHEHRVAARRARAALHVTRGYLDPSWRRPMRDALGALAEASGPVRDLDVLLETLRGELDELDESDRDAGAVVQQRLESERDTARRRLAETLDSGDYRLVLTRLRRPPRLAEGVETIPLERLARKEFRKLVKAVDRAGKHPDSQTIHRLRLVLKRARYGAELAVPKGRARGRFLGAARVLQDLLGEHHDSVVAEDRLRAVTVDDVHTAAAFAAGRLAERQHARRARIQERLPAAWKRLRKSGAGLS